MKNHNYRKKLKFKGVLMIYNVAAALAVSFTSLSALAVSGDASLIDRSVSNTISAEYSFVQRPAIMRSESLNNLSQKRSQSPQGVIGNYLSDNNKDPRIADSLEVIRLHETKFGDTHYILQQYINGLRVYGSDVKLTIASDGSVSSIIDRLPSRYDDRVSAAIVTQPEALRHAIEWSFPNAASTVAIKHTEGNKTFFENDGFFYNEPSIEQIVLLRQDGSLETGYLAFLWSQESKLLYETVLDSNGRVVKNILRTVFDTYRIYDPFPSPPFLPQILVEGPGNGNAESPIGWLSNRVRGMRSIHIRGNNTNTYLDRDNNGNPDAGGTLVSNGVFDAFSDLSQEPTTATNQDVAVQNLFYYMNLIHDELYRHGFTETAGNFQQSNFGLGGSQGDPILAQAQDGGFSNNATFTPTPDGQSPLIQMHLFTNPTPDRDSSLDGDIIWHEYGHGLTWRMIGEMDGPVAGAIGEGVSDALTIIMTNNDVVGEYSAQNPIGLRNERYTDYSRTIGDFWVGDFRHNNGEIYAATMWRLWELFQENDISRDLLLDHIVNAMNFTPARPDFLDMRDSLLMSMPADLGCYVWRSFARYGMGVGAVFGLNGSTIVERFSFPLECTPPSIPSVPPNFHIRTYGGGINVLDWQPLFAASHYKIYRSTTINGPYSFVANHSSHNYQVNVFSNTYYKVKACSALGCSNFTSPRLAFYQACGGIGEPPCE